MIQCQFAVLAANPHTTGLRIAKVAWEDMCLSLFIRFYRRLSDQRLSFWPLLCIMFAELQSKPGQLFWLDGSFFEAKTGPIELAEILADRAEQITGQFAKRLGEQGEGYSAGDIR